MQGDKPPGSDRIAATPATRDKSAQIDRESAALRANLRKRKQQVQAREAARQTATRPADAEPPER